ncbi:LANO_0H15126g1_1 [Lachancea nothofagi CBS 11611]|uniref:mitogen-activated protein kinase kinase n=1 Tax=Lachancea nothofagi CBS 11611 TaxID=1266666 RepID=A0A1G4KMR4_9SACH|nr:LANO_0H15126g1_1 [Lachancea nothofagi CBS 11611]
MASMFRPPESARGSSKSPKLTLPSALKQSSNEAPSLPSGHTSSMATPISSSSSQTLTFPRPMKSSSSSSSINTLKKRPVPPPMPPLAIPSSAGAGTPDNSLLTDSLEKLKLDEPQICHGRTGSRDTSSEETSESGISPAPTPPSAYAIADVDELDEETWQSGIVKGHIVTMGVLGEGAGGSVAKCRLKYGTKIFALKTITTVNSDPETQKQVFRELQFNRSCSSEYIVRYFGMFTDNTNSSIYIAMEYMGGRSLEAIYKHLLSRGGRIGERVLGKIAESVLKGLSYLQERKIIHRDIKPQNILLNQMGQVKLCDFGVSGEAVNSLATTFTGTSFYMAPERIQGQPYSVTSDVWSLGLTLLEVAQAQFPFGSDKVAANMPPIELLMLILTFTPELRDAPELSIVWSKSFKSFIQYCLSKEPRDRPSPRQMLQHPWVLGQMKKSCNMQKFILKCWQE